MEGIHEVVGVHLVTRTMVVEGVTAGEIGTAEGHPQGEAVMISIVCIVVKTIIVCSLSYFQFYKYICLGAVSVSTTLLLPCFHI